MLVHNKGKYVRHRGTVRVLPGVNDIKEKTGTILNLIR